MDGWIVGGRCKDGMFFNRSRDADFEHAQLFLNSSVSFKLGRSDIGWILQESTGFGSFKARILIVHRLLEGFTCSTSFCL